MNELTFPSQWMVVALDEVVDKIVGGGTPSKSVPSYYQGEIPWMTVKDMNKYVLNDTVDHISKEAVKNSATNIIPAGTPIIATRMSLGKLVRANFDSAINQDLKAIFINDNVSKIYFEYWYRSISQKIQEMGTGTTVKGVRLEDVKQLNFALAPLTEQKEIARKLDELLTQVDIIKTRLDAIPNILKRFRQSVLAAAVSGRLTAEWRESDEILLSDIALKITDGEHLTPKTEAEGIPLLSAKDVQSEALLFDNCKYISKNVADKARSRCNPEIGDILIVSRGATVGRTHLIKINREFCLMGSVLLIKLDSNIVAPKYMELIFKDPVGQKQLIGSSGASAQQAIYIRDVKNFKLNLPPIEVQKNIVNRVEQLFAHSDQIEKRVKDAQARANHLTQSILAKAFRGELTAEWRAQNPELILGDNSAVALLEKIKVERESAVKPKRKVKA